jgi:hypothetical protein
MYQDSMVQVACLFACESYAITSKSPQASMTVSTKSGTQETGSFTKAVFE